MEISGKKAVCSYRSLRGLFHKFNFRGAVLFLFFLSCSTSTTKRPEGLIPEETYIKLLAESQLIATFKSTYGDSSITDSIRRVFLNTYNIDTTNLFKSHNWYRSDVINQKIRLEKANKILEAAMEKLEVEAYRMAQTPDSSSN